MREFNDDGIRSAISWDQSNDNFEKNSILPAQLKTIR